MNIKQFIDDLALNEAETVRIDCPSCRGKKTFTAIKMDGSTIFNCYKLGCGTKGAVRSGYSREDIATILNKKNSVPVIDEPQKFVFPEYVSHDIDNRWMHKFIDKWNLHDTYLLYDVKDERAVFPIRSRNGMILDAVGRSLTGKSPKWLRYSGKADFFLSSKTDNTYCAVVVEDVISAIAIAENMDATGFALLGTSLSSKSRQELCKYHKVIVALDPDARNKTLSLTKELRATQSIVHAMSLQDDIKYKNYVDLKRLDGLINMNRRTAV